MKRSNPDKPLQFWRQTNPGDVFHLKAGWRRQLDPVELSFNLQIKTTFTTPDNLCESVAAE